MIILKIFPIISRHTSLKGIKWTVDVSKVLKWTVNEICYSKKMAADINDLSVELLDEKFEFEYIRWRDVEGWVSKLCGESVSKLDSPTPHSSPSNKDKKTNLIVINRHKSEKYLINEFDLFVIYNRYRL